MKTVSLKKILFIIMLFACKSAFAHDFEANGIYYGISIFNKNTAYVTHSGKNYNDAKEYSGSVVIPESVSYNGKTYSVASIGGYAFAGCDELTSVTIPSSVKTINQYAFNGCSGLQTVECKSSTPPTCKENVFSGVNTKSVQIVVPASGKSSYKSADTWKNFKWGLSVGETTEVGGLTYKVTSETAVEVIAGASKYTGNVTIPSEITIEGDKFAVTKIGNDAFNECTGLTSIIIPSSVSSIGNTAFCGCTGLTSVTSQNPTPPTCGTNVFGGVNTQNIPLTVPAESLSLYKSADTWKNFKYPVSIGDTKEVDGLTYKVISETAVEVIAGASKYTGAVTIPSEITIEIDKYAVTKIGNDAFNECTGLTSIVIPSSVSSIGNTAFYGCTGLTSVTSQNLTPPTCGTNVFGGVNTQNIPLTVPAESLSLYKSADTWNDFKYPILIGETKEIEGLTYKVTGETAVDVIAGASKYTGAVTIPSEITIEGDKYAVTKIGNDAFNGCTGLTSIIIPSSVSSIGNSAFYGCTGLTSVTSENPTPPTCGTNAFGNVNTQNISLTVPLESVSQYKSADTWKNFKFAVSIGETKEEGGITYKVVSGTAVEVVAGASKYTGAVTIPSEVTIYGNKYAVTRIGNDAFRECTGLTSIVIPNSVTEISELSFYGCTGLTSIIIPSSVSSIGNLAFYGCTGLTSITSENPTPPACGTGVFGGVNTQNITLTVPAESVELYKSVDTWKDFKYPLSVGETKEVGGITYRVTSETTVEVIAGASKYTGAVTIPSEITIEGDKYAVTAIGDEAFSECTGLTSITIPNSVTTIGDEAFCFCDGLTNITIPNSVTSIVSNPFYGSGLTSITVKSGNAKYDSRDNCNAIIETATNTLISGCKNTIIPNSVTTIGKKAFYFCASLTNITIPNSVTAIDDEAFRNCTGLTSVTSLNPTPPTCGTDVFGGVNTQNILLTVPDESVSLYKSADTWKNFKFPVSIGDTKEVEGLTYRVTSETAVEVIAGASKYTGAVTIPSEVTIEGDKFAVTKIGNDAFNGCTGLTSIVIPNSITKIGGLSFYGCTGLTEITIPSSVTDIRNLAFYGCTGLTGVTSLNPTPPACGENVFGGVNTQNILLTVPDESIELYKSTDTWKDFKFTVSIGDIKEVGGLTYKVISETTVEVIAGASKYTGDIVIPSEVTIEGDKYAVTAIGDEAFSECSGLTSVTIPNSVTSIGSLAFYSCSALTSVTIPNSVTTIKYGAFYACKGLISITIPNSVTEIGVETFSGCYGLTNITVESGNTVYDSRDNCNAIIETATDKLISGCKNTTIPNSVTSIDSYAFRGCYGLTGITIPSSVNTIGSYAFDMCTGLTSVTSLNPTPPTCGTDVFLNLNVSNITLTVPDESIELYKSADTWKDFKFAVSIGETKEVEGLTYKVISETTVEVIAGASKYTGDIVIPSEVTIEGDKYAVTAIGDEAFSECTGLTSVMLPNTVISIGNSAFYCCVGMTSITIPNRVIVISNNAFASCNGLNKITVESGNTVYDSRDNCNAIIETATNTLVVGCETTTIPISVTSIGDFAFYFCIDLTSITIPNNVSSIGDNAFAGCRGLTSVTSLNPTPPACGTGVFGGVNTQNITLTVPAESVELYKSADTWKDFKYPLSVGETKEVEGLTYKVISETTVEVIAGASKYTGDIVIPSEVTIEGDKYAVTAIGAEAFSECSGLTSVTIPSSVSSIGYEAFYDCTGLTSVISQNPTPPTCDTNVFGGVNIQNIPLTVPDESVSLYQSADTWKDFGTINGITGGETPKEPTLEEVWVHDMSTYGAAVRNIALVNGNEVAATNISFSGGDDNILFFDAEGQMSKAYDVRAFLEQNRIGTTDENNVFTAYTLGRGIAVDGAGNIVVNLGFNNASSATNFLAITPDSTMRHIVCEVPSPGVAARTDFFDVTGDIFKNAYIGLASHGQSVVAVYNIFLGAQDMDYSYLVNTDDISLTNETKVFWAKKNIYSLVSDYAPEFFVYHRSASGMRYSNGASDLVKLEGDNFSQGRATCTGATAFEVKGTTYIVMPTTDTDGTRNKAFKVVNVTTGEVVATSQGVAGFSDSYTQDYSAWVNEDGTVSIAQLVQGQYLAMYKFTLKVASMISYGASMSDVEDVHAEEAEAEVEYYNLQGVRVYNPGKGIYIKRQGGRTSKVVL